MDDLKTRDEEMIVVAPRTGSYLFTRGAETVLIYLRAWQRTLIRVNLEPLSKWSSPDLVDSFTLAQADSLLESPFEFNRT